MEGITTRGGGGREDGGPERGRRIGDGQARRDKNGVFTVDRLCEMGSYRLPVVTELRELSHVKRHLMPFNAGCSGGEAPTQECPAEIKLGQHSREQSGGRVYVCTAIVEEGRLFLRTVGT